MNSIKRFQNRSYEQHAENFNEYRTGGKKEKHAKTWFETDTVDAWRHQRMYWTLDPILNAEPEATWLTIGDGRYGKDAHYINVKECDAMASDISGVLLKEAKEIGYITAFQIENAESLTFNAESFDYVFCKEAYHHFPRPVLALYEMLRVAKKGVILIEPNDAYISNKIFSIIGKKIIKTIKFLFGIENIRNRYEESGNYVYTISRREVEKIALGLNYKTLAFKSINDAYLPGVEYENLSDNGPIQKKIRRSINLKNILCKLRVMDYGILSTIIFKESPNRALCIDLSKDNFEIVHLSDNPYIIS